MTRHRLWRALSPSALINAAAHLADRTVCAWANTTADDAPICRDCHTHHKETP